MARSTAQQAFPTDRSRATTSQNLRDFEDSWPEEPTSIDAAMTMEEMILEELRRQGTVTPESHPNPPVKKGTLTR